MVGSHNAYGIMVIVGFVYQVTKKTLHKPKKTSTNYGETTKIVVFTIYSNHNRKWLWLLSLDVVPKNLWFQVCQIQIMSIYKCFGIDLHASIIFHSYGYILLLNGWVLELSVGNIAVLWCTENSKSSIFGSPSKFCKLKCISLSALARIETKKRFFSDSR